LGPNGEVAYIRLNAFNENAGQLVREAMRAALQRDPQGLVFDLRGNSGGLLREAVKVASVFLEDQVVLHERLNGERSETYRTVGDAVTTDLPMVVLVDEATASASEIVAGALQDAGRATLLGTQTYGKGSVQLPHNLSNGAILRVTIARWYTPLERTIDGVGLAPDQLVEMTQAQLERGDDPQLAAALAHLTPAQTAQPQP
jgi:carboxyl-terminal processing protease